MIGNHNGSYSFSISGLGNAVWETVYQSDFSVDTNGWTSVSTNSTLTGNIDAIFAENDTLRLVSNLTSTADFAERLASSIVAGGVYRISFDVLRATGNTGADVGIQVGDVGAIQTLASFDTWTSYSTGAIIASNTAVPQIRLGTSTSGDTWYFKNILIEKLG